jgi:RNA polymerase sigma-70 factor (ECF subfamily)
MQVQEEIVLVQRLKEGDNKAFNELFSRYGKWLYEEAYHKLGRNVTDAEDLVQEVFARLWEKRRNVDPDRPIHNYLWIAMRNAAYDKYKKSRHQEHYINQQMHNEQEVNPFEGIDLADQLVRAIDGLTNPNAKTVIRKFYYEDKSYNTIREETGIAAETARKIIARSLPWLRKKIKFR